MPSSTIRQDRSSSGAGEKSGARLTADERRHDVLAAAMIEFAATGYAGTSTEAIASRAGISQPYLFRLYGTKRDLFIATMAEMHRRIELAFRDATADLDGEEALMAMGGAYKELLQERELLMMQLHAFAASNDPEIRSAARLGFRGLWNVVSELSGLDMDQLRPFFAQGMLLNVMAAMDAAELDEAWARACHPEADELFPGSSSN